MESSACRRPSSSTPKGASSRSTSDRSTAPPSSPWWRGREEVAGDAGRLCAVRTAGARAGSAAGTAALREIARSADRRGRRAPPLPGLPGALHRRLARDHGAQHESRGAREAGVRLRPGADPRRLRALLRRVRPAPAARARRELAGLVWAGGNAARRWRRGRLGIEAVATSARRGSPPPAGFRPALARHAPRRSAARRCRPAGADAGLWLARRHLSERAAMNAGTSVEWVPALVVLGAGLIAGFVLVWRVLSSSRRAAKAGVTALEARDLAGKSEVLLRQLRELEDTASKRTPEQLARERYALELETAKTLLALEAKPAPESAASGGARQSATLQPAPDAARDRAGLRGFLWGIGSAAGVLLLGFFVYQSAKPREPGGSLTGNAPMASKPAGEAADGEEAQLQ